MFQSQSSFYVSLKHGFGLEDSQNVSAWHGDDQRQPMHNMIRRPVPHRAEGTSSPYVGIIDNLPKGSRRARGADFCPKDLFAFARSLGSMLEGSVAMVALLDKARTFPRRYSAGRTTTETCAFT